MVLAKEKAPFFIERVPFRYLDNPGAWCLVFFFQALLGALPLDVGGVEVGGTIDEIVVHQIGKHVHRALADLVHIDMEGRKRRADNVSVFGADKREDLDVFRDSQTRIGSGVLNGAGKRVAGADEKAFVVLRLREVFPELVVGAGIGIIAVDDAVFLAELLVGLDEDLLAAVEQAAAVMDVKEGHWGFPAFFVVFVNDAAKRCAIREMDVAHVVTDDFIVEHDDRDVIRSDRLDVFREQLVIIDDDAIDVGGDDFLHHREGFFAVVGRREQGQDVVLLPRGFRNAGKKVGNVDVVGARNDDADVGRAIGRQGLGKAARLVAEGDDGVFDLLTRGLRDGCLLVDDTADGR